ncbi:hypothetical protein F0562_005102 [Nyssa sinensis]|uniref:SPX domain-containing protein n=1 Tax=Nyssa sinensis TaxID=561372 RepID=A0A5J5AH89_9ASTE|nr:hypothetical protein F0562_005102 [Nyssa sinensis]
MFLFIEIDVISVDAEFQKKPMKFGKEFTSQMVHEWQEAYMDYHRLKTVLKDILHFRQKNTSSTIAATPKGSLKRRLSLYRAFSGLTSLYNSPRGSLETVNEDEVILVSAVQEEGSEGYYQTSFLMSSDHGGEYELVFFRRLDDEFNKVVKFYRAKVEIVVKEAEELNKQMNALIALRIKVDNPVVELQCAKEINLATNGSSSNAAPIPPTNTGRKPRMSNMDIIQEVEMSSEGMSNMDAIQEVEMTSEGMSNMDAIQEVEMSSVGNLEVEMRLANKPNSSNLRKSNKRRQILWASGQLH